jgi:hypothetical protein
MHLFVEGSVLCTQDTLEEGILAIHPNTSVAGIDGSGSCGGVQMCFAKHWPLG